MNPAQSLLPTIRLAVEEDLPRIAWLEEEAFADPWPFDLLAYEFQHPRGFLLVATWGDGAAPAGYVAFRYGGGEAEMLRLAVDPRERRRGIARMLVDHGLERLRQSRVQSCHLEVRLDNQSAIAFYEALGFGRTGRRKSYYRDGTDALLYSLGL